MAAGRSSARCGDDGRLELVRPQVWQRAFSLGTASRCASKSVWKNKLKAEAQRRFPDLLVTHSTADALLILEWHTGQAQQTALKLKAADGSPCN